MGQDMETDPPQLQPDGIARWVKPPLWTPCNPVRLFSSLLFTTKLEPKYFVELVVR